MTIQVGYSQGCLTPKLERSVYLAGFGRNRIAKSVHDDLYVRALALQQGSSRLALASLDLIGLARGHCLQIEELVNRQFPGTRVIVACTHTHHGPDTLGLWGKDEATRGVDDAWLADAKDKIVASICQACVAMQAADSQKSFSVRVPGVARNARDPGILDDELTGLQFSTAGGRPLATVLIFPCHPEVLWEHNPHITADYVCGLRREVEAAGGGPCLFLAGALGGMMTPAVRDHSFAESEAMGVALAQAALGALAAAPAVTAGPLSFARQLFSIPLHSPLLELAIGAGLLPDERSPDGTLQTEANLVAIGPTWLATVPGELLPALGLTIKAQLRSAGAGVAAVVGLANDELGYILPQESFRYPDDPFNPGDHYEETMSVGSEAGPRLMEAVEILWQARLEFLHI